MKNLTFTLILLSSFSCSEKLPKPTEIGNNTFGCKVDGKTWIPDGDGALISPQKPISGGFYKNVQSNGTYINVFTVNTADEEVEFYINNENIGTYILDKNTGFVPNQLFPKNYGLYRVKGKTYITSTVNTGKVIITKSERLTTGIISGTFEFTVGAGNETVKVTNGRFDINTKKL